MSRVICKQEYLEESKPVHDAFDVVNYMVRDGIDKGLIVAVLEGYEPPAGVVQAADAAQPPDHQGIG